MISVEKARSLVDMAYSGTIHEDKRGIALEVYVEAVNIHNLVEVAVATAEHTSQALDPVETWRGGDRVRLSGVSRYGKKVDGLIGVVDEMQFHRPLISVTPETINGVLVTPEQLTRI